MREPGDGKPSTVTAVPVTNSISDNGNRSRTSSDSSQRSEVLCHAPQPVHISETTESDDIDETEDSWALWGELVNDWTNQFKKRGPFIKVRQSSFLPF